MSKTEYGTTIKTTRRYSASLPLELARSAIEESKKEKEEKRMSKNRFANTEVSLKHEGSQIILPAEPHAMSLDEGMETLRRLKEENETIISVNEIVQALPFDGAHAFMHVMKNRYGWATPVPTKTFFGDVPPQTISLEISHGQTTQVIWGEFIIPGIEGQLSTGATNQEGRYLFCMTGKVKKKYQAEIKALADGVREYVRQESIYKGKAIRLKTDSDGELDVRTPPKFLDITGYKENELIFSEAVMNQIEANLFNRIENTAACRRFGIPLKSGLLFESSYGTGKTLTAYITAKKCERNGWTFILVDDVRAIKDALLFANLYAPAVVFAEDIDRVVTGERSSEMDDILNTLDGVVSKSSEIITVFTTNHVDKIHKALLRPGRLDTIIHVTPPDASAVDRLIRLYGRGCVSEKLDFSEVASTLAGCTPAVVRETVEKAKLFAVMRQPEATRLSVTASDLEEAARLMKHHLSYMAPKSEATPTVEHKLGSAMVDIIHTGLVGNGLAGKVNDIYKAVT
jgi:transitional endoplasmic reticulum ATPase